MKKLTTISLFIFAVVVTALLVAGLVFYQNKNTNQIKGGVNTTDNLAGATLNLQEISKHNNQSDCWILISGKVYDITSYFGKHPGGNATMTATCGTDATNAYKTKDPNAKMNYGVTSHSSNARNLLTDYYIGDLNQTIQNNPKQVSSNNVVDNPIKNNTNTTNNIVSPIVIPPVFSLGNITLSLQEISKHNKQTDCWYLINGKVYNITSYFGSHPGGNSTMVSSCGEDATAAYMTKDPNATTSGSRSAHSSNAINLLNNYYIGDLNQTIGQQKIADANTIVAPPNNGDDEYEYEDD